MSIILSLESDIRAIAGVGKILAQQLKILGITTVRDLIFYLPFRFDDFTRLVPIRDLKASETVTIRGTIRLIQNRRSWKMRKIVTEAIVSDDTGEVKVIWFNQPFLSKNLIVGDVVSFSGKTSDNYYALQMVSPAYEKIQHDQTALHTGGLVPVYSLTANITQKQFRTFIKKALDKCLASIQEFLPLEIVVLEKLMSLSTTLVSIHFPHDKNDFLLAQGRLAFDELLFLHLRNLINRKNNASLASISVPFDSSLIKSFIKKLPFPLTKSQKETAWEILKNMEKAMPMNRILEGDVGSGKTVVAAIAALNVISRGLQVAFMAPTEVLAQQHFETFQDYFQEFSFSIALLTSSDVRIAGQNSLESLRIRKNKIYSAIRNGEIAYVIGTHALLQDSFNFSHLALAIIDEQHRFGVKQRKILREKNANGIMPHLLSLSATPIPRSLALTVYGDLDVSLLEGLPHGRKKVITKIVPQKYREWVYEFIRKQVKKGHQAFIIFPLIDPSDVLGVRSVTQEYERLSKGDLQDIRLGILHGKMKHKDKEEIMKMMLHKEIDVLLSTSVIEVGVDIANASCMLIEGAERFGLAQLHQFRGRVGRSSIQSYCFLLPTVATHESKARLKIFTSSNDGFYLAQKDLELRGEGDVFGFRQSGMPFLRIANLNDTVLIKKTKEYALKLYDRMDEYPEIKKRFEHTQHDVHFE